MAFVLPIPYVVLNANAYIGSSSVYCRHIAISELHADSPTFQFCWWCSLGYNLRLPINIHAYQSGTIPFDHGAVIICFVHPPLYRYGYRNTNGINNRIEPASIDTMNRYILWHWETLCNGISNGNGVAYFHYGFRIALSPPSY